MSTTRDLLFEALATVRGRPAAEAVVCMPDTKIVVVGDLLTFVGNNHQKISGGVEKILPMQEGDCGYIKEPHSHLVFQIRETDSKWIVNIEEVWQQFFREQSQAEEAPETPTPVLCDEARKALFAQMAAKI